MGYDQTLADALKEIRILRKALEELADASEEAASSDPDMPSYKESGLRFDSALDAARALLSGLIRA